MTSAAPESGLRERKKAQTRAAFIDTGLALFGERGYHAVTVEDICEVVGVSPRTYFRYFATKADLVIAELDRLLATMLDDLRARPVTESAWTALRHALGAVAALITSKAKPYAVLNSVIQSAPELVAGNAAALLEWEQQMTDEATLRLPAPAHPHARLMTGLALTTFRVTADAWLASGGDLADRLASGLALVEPAARRIAASG